MKKRRKVWVVSAFTWDIHTIEGIFSTKEKAEDYLKEIEPQLKQEYLIGDIEWYYLNEGGRA